MSAFHEVDVKTLGNNPFTMIGDQWMLVTAGTAASLNTMTASWGGVGVLWGKPVSFVFVRPQRYTREFVDNNDYYTLSFLPQKYRKALNFCGSHSGRDVDKVAETGLTTAAEMAGNAPYFEEADLVLVCRKLYRQEMAPGGFIDHSIIGKDYPQKDFHLMYVGEIVKALKKD